MGEKDITQHCIPFDVHPVACGLLELRRFDGAIIAGSFVKRARYEPIRLIEKPKGMLRSN
jgi:hypothetical protein